MAELRSKICSFLLDEEGPTAVEYAVMLMMVFLAVILVVQSIGNSLNSNLETSSQAIDAATTGS